MFNGRNPRKLSFLGIKAKLSRIESEEFNIDQVNHNWIYEVNIGIKLFNGLIELPENAENITVTNPEYNISLQPKEHKFKLERKIFPYFQILELAVSFVTKPRLDQIISYISEDEVIGNKDEWIRNITVKNKRNYEIKKIRLERSIDFEPSTFKIQELTSSGSIILPSAFVQISKDTQSRTAKSTILAWETGFSKGETKQFNLYCKYPSQEVPIASQIVSLVNKSNLLFEEITSVKQLFRESMLVADELHTTCRAERDFSHKVGVLCQLFEVKLEPLRKLLRNADPSWRSIKLLEEWLNNSGVSYDSEIIQTWRNIVELRNASPPFHRPDRRVLRLCEFFGQGYPPNYVELWSSVINKLKDSFEKLLEALRTLRA